MFQLERTLLLLALACLQITWVMTSAETEEALNEMGEDNPYMEGLLQELLARGQDLSENDLGNRGPLGFSGDKLEADEKRAHLFVGRRADENVDDVIADKRRARLFVGKRADEEDEKRAHMFVGKRAHMFVGKREDEEWDKRGSTRRFIGKRAHMFVGKRPWWFVSNQDEDGSKRARMFVGKRGYNDEEDEKRAHMFVGKRAPHMFVGKRFEDADEKRAHMFVGKRSTDDEQDTNEEKRNRKFVGKKAHMFVGRRSDMDDDKRAHMFVGKKSDSRMFVGHNGPLEEYFANLKRARYFVGKRAEEENNDDLDNDFNKRARLFVGKRSSPSDASSSEAEIVKRSVQLPAENLAERVESKNTAIKSKRDTSSILKDNQLIKESTRDI